jgi:hypothetical protein
VAQWKEPRCRAEDGVAAAARLRATSRLYAAAERVHAAHLAANAEAAQSHAVHIAALGDNNNNSSSSSSCNNHRNHQRRHRGSCDGESEGGGGDIVGSGANGFVKDSSNSRSVRLDLSACSFPCIGNGSGVSNLPPRSPLRLSSSVGSDRLGGVALLTASTHSRAAVASIGGGRASPAQVQAEAQAVAAASSSSLARIPSSQHKQKVPSQRAPSRGEDAGVISVKGNRGNKHARGMFEGSEYRVRPVPRGLF